MCCCHASEATEWITEITLHWAQGVTDCLAQYGVRKAQAQRVLDELVAAADGIVCKVSARSRPSGSPSTMTH